MDLSRPRRRNRLLPVFATSDEGAERRRDLLEGHEEEVGFADRDPLVFRLFQEGSGGAAGERPVTPEEAGTVRDVFGVEDGRFAAVLVGKDGQVRIRRPSPRRISSPA